MFGLSPAACLAGALLCAAPSAVTAQVDGLAEGDRLYTELRGDASLRAFERVLQREPDDFEALWKAARGELMLGDLEKRNFAVRDAHYRKAQEYAGRAIAVDSTRIEGYYWRVSAKGREALHSGFSTAARLAGEVYLEARDVLARDSLYAGAHHVLGLLNYEVMILPPLKRWLGRKLLGNPGLYDMSWENARRYLERAVELDPTMIVYGFDLARFYETRGEIDAALAEFRRVLTLKQIHPIDAPLQASARQHIRDLGDLADGREGRPGGE